MNKIEHQNPNDNARFFDMVHRQRMESLSVRFLAEQIPDMNWADYDREIHRSIDIAQRFCDIFDIRFGKTPIKGGLE